MEWVIGVEGSLKGFICTIGAFDRRLALRFTFPDMAWRGVILASFGGYRQECPF